MEGDVAIHCADLLPETPDAIVATASELSSHRNRIAQAAASVRTLASAVRSKVGKVLAALQVGDMTRQRLEHVRDGLALLETAGADLADEPRARFMSLGREFLVALLNSASEDFNSEIQMIGRNLEGLAGDAVGQEGVVPPAPQPAVQMLDALGQGAEHQRAPTLGERLFQELRQGQVQGRPLEVIEPDLAGRLGHHRTRGAAAAG